MNKAVKSKNETITRLTEELKRDIERKEQQDQHIEGLSRDTESYRTSIDEHNKQFYEMKKTKDQLQSERNEHWRK